VELAGRRLGATELGHRGGRRLRSRIRRFQWTDPHTKPRPGCPRMFGRSVKHVWTEPPGSLAPPCGAEGGAPRGPSGPRHRPVCAPLQTVPNPPPPHKGPAMAHTRMKGSPKRQISGTPQLASRLLEEAVAVQINFFLVERGGEDCQVSGFGFPCVCECPCLSPLQLAVSGPGPRAPPGGRPAKGDSEGPATAAWPLPNRCVRRPRPRPSSLLF